MPTYVFQGTNRAGQRVSGERAAANRQALTAVLRREQIQPLRVSEKTLKQKRDKKVPMAAQAVFFKQFSVMIEAGLPLVECLELASTNLEVPDFAHVLNAVRTAVESGTTLSAAMRQHPRVFDDLTTNLIEAGETGGILDTILRRLSTYTEKALKLRQALKSAMIYPVTVISIASLIVFFLLWKIVPIFTKLFASLNATLPLPTRIVIAISHIIGQFWWAFIFLPPAIIIGLQQYHRTERGRMVLDTFMLKIWVIGPTLRKIAIARFSRTLGTLITSGVPILDGLAITARTAGNAVVERAIMSVRAAIEQGKTIVEPMRQSGVFPNMVIQMIGAGEQTGSMDSMLQKLADFYEDEVDAATKNLLTLLEPMMIVFLGTTIGGIVISMYLPMFSLMAQMANQAH